MIPLDKDRQRRSESEGEDQIEPRGDPEMAPLYLRRLLPVFCTTFQSTMLASVRKASLGLIKKMIHYIQPSLLEELCSSESASNNFGTQLVEVIATVLDNEVCIVIYCYIWCRYILDFEIVWFMVKSFFRNEQKFMYQFYFRLLRV